MSLNRNPASSLQDQLAQLSLQHFQSLPDELLISLFRYLSSFERTRLLSTCKRWNHIILLHTPFWQYLTVPNDLPFHLVFTILLTFTYRSGFKLRHVIIETLIADEKELEMIFAVLEKSGGSLSFLALLQEDEGLNNRTRKLAMKKLPRLDSLITHSDHEDLQFSVAHFMLQRLRYGIEDQDDGSGGLRMYYTENLSGMMDEEMKWLSKLNYLEVIETGSTRELLLLLEKCQNLTELDLSQWDADEETLETMDRNPLLNPHMTRVSLQGLKEIVLPLAEPSARALNSLLDLDGKKVSLVGFIYSLLSFDVLYLKSLWIYMTQGYEPFQEFEAAVMLLFEKNQFVEHLSLDGPKEDESEEQRRYFDVILEKLCLVKQDDQRADADKSKTEAKGQNEVCQFFPNLVRLNVLKPAIYFKGFFLKILESRRKQNPEFQMIFLDEFGEEITCGYWAGRNWMD